MITYYQASKIAYDYFKSKCNIVGLSEAMENKTCFIFSCGKANTANFGGITIAVDKVNSNVSVLRFPSKESTNIIKNSVQLEICKDFIDNN